MKFPVSASNVASSKPYIGLLLRKDTKDILLSIYHFSSIISMHGRTIINSKFYYIFTKPTNIRQLKSFMCIKSNTISRMRILIRIRILSQLKDTIKAYFCYHYTLLYTTTLSMLFYLFWNYTCVILMDAL